MRQRAVRGGEDADFDLVDLGVGQRAPDHFAARQLVHEADFGEERNAFAANQQALDHGGGIEEFCEFAHHQAVDGRQAEKGTN